MFNKFKSFFQRKKERKVEVLDTEKVQIMKQKLKKKLFGDDQQLSHLQQFEQDDKNNRLNKRFVVSDDFDGIIRNRKVTDKYFIHVAVFISIVFLSRLIMIFVQSNQQKISFPQDFRAQECGLNNLKHKNYLYYILPNVELNLKMCVEKCPQDTNREICLYRIDGIKEHTEERFCYSTVQSRQVGKVCVPVETKTRSTVLDVIYQHRNFARNLLGDVYHVIFPIIICFVVIILLQSFFALIIQIDKISLYINISHFILGMIGICTCWIYLFFDYKSHIKNFCYQEIVTNFCLTFKGKFMYYFCIFLIGFIIIFVVYILFYIKKIYIAFKFLKTQIKTFRKVRTLISFYGNIQILLILFSALYLNFVIAWFSQGKVIKVDAKNVDGGQVKLYKFFDYNYFLLCFDLFLILLLLKFIINFNKVITIFSVTDWYFTRKKKATKFKIGSLLKIFFRYHFGTFLKFTILQHTFDPIKMLIENLIKVLKLLNNDLDIIRFFISLFFPLLLFYHKFLKYIDQGLFVHVILWGDHYIKSAQKNYFLQLRNRKYKTKHIQWLKLIGKVQFLGAVLLICSLFYIIILYIGTEKGDYFQNIDQLFSVIYFMFIFSQFLNSGFYDNFYCMQQTLIQCYMIDTEMFYGEQLFYENLFNNFAQNYLNFSNELDNDHTIFGFRFKKKDKKLQEYQIQAINNVDEESEYDSDSENSKISSKSEEIKSQKSSKNEQSFSQKSQLQVIEKSMAQHSKSNLQNFDQIKKS